MSADPNPAKVIFMAAVGLGSAAERDAYLAEACGNDAGLRRWVDALLRANDEPGSFLGTPAVVAYGGADVFENDTRSGPAAGDGGDTIEFLSPSDAPGVLGRLGHYEIREVVGRGGMGVVLRAFDEKLHREVAIKMMAPRLAASASARRQFVREARAAAAVTHDHVVTIHAVEETGPLPYLVMQYVAGTSLQDRISRTGPLPLPEALRVGAQAARGLAAAHAQGLVHQDVKPANILLESGTERVKLTDFGLARAADDASLTRSGIVAGTPLYMSPEQASGKPVDHRSDLFSLGSVLYVMCTGRPPFRDRSSMAVLKRVCEDTPTPVRESNPEVPDWLAGLIGKLHAKDPAGRFQSAAEVAEVLEDHLTRLQAPTASPAAGRLPQSARRRWAVAAAVLVLSIAGLGLSEAAGVTELRAAVFRIFSPDGTLVVETDDPDVKVTIEGDGGQLITGFGSQEVQVRPGRYKIYAAKDDQVILVDRHVVALTRGGREQVKVGGEPSVPPPVRQEAAAGELMVNGSFEEAPLPGEMDMYSNDPAFHLPGWKYPILINKCFVERGKPYGIARYADGQQAICLNGDGVPVALSQVLRTVAGRTYTLTFSLGEETEVRPSPTSVVVTFGTLTRTCKLDKAEGFVVFSLTYTATSDQTLLEFWDNTPATERYHSPFLDAVSVVEAKPK